MSRFTTHDFYKSNKDERTPDDAIEEWILDAKIFNAKKDLKYWQSHPEHPFNDSDDPDGYGVGVCYCYLGNGIASCENMIREYEAILAKLVAAEKIRIND
jgi:hypothetical protein